jgi:GDP-L-fucose synthase
MKKDSKIYVAGHNGMVGSSILRRLKIDGFDNLITKSKEELDLTNQQSVSDFFNDEKPEYVFLAAAKVGGILSNNTYKADFIYQNLMIQSNIIHNSYLHGVKKLVFLGSSCIYPKNCPQPIKEEYLLSGQLESTNDAYAIAKIAGIKMCQSYNQQYGTNFISVMPTNLYGPGDNYHLQNSHVLPALLRKFHDAKMNGEPEVVVWGSGKPMREFLYVDDLVDSILFLMENYNESDIVNIGSGVDISIRDLAHLIKEELNYNGNVIYDSSKPDGTPRKLLDVSKLHDMGWVHKTNLKEGIKLTYKHFLKLYNEQMLLSKVGRI